MVDVDSKLIDSTIESIYSKLDSGGSYSPVVRPKVSFLDEELINYNNFTIRIDIGEVSYIVDLYQVSEYDLRYKILRYFKLDTYYLSITVRERQFLKNTYNFKSNKKNYNKYKELYNTLIFSKPKVDRKKYEENATKWTNILDGAISTSRKRDQKLNKLINK